MAGTFNGAVPAPSVEHGYHFHFGNVEKKINSTKAFDYGVLKDEERCDFKKPTSMEHPVIYCTINSINISPQWNYCQCEETKSFYWIDDITTLRANIWQISLTLDPLATYRDTILKTKAFIEYGFNSDASGAQFRLQDARQNVARKPTVSSAEVDTCPGTISASGCYVLSAVGKNGLQAYALSRTQLATLLTLLSTTWLAETAAMVKWEVALPQFMNNLLFGGNATENIRSCIWIPVDDNLVGTGGGLITLGQFDTGITAPVVSANSNKVHVVNIPIPWPAEDWKRMNCQIQLYVPFIGVVGIPVDQCNDAASVTVITAFSFIDGGVSVKIQAGDYTVYTGSTNISSPYGIGSSNYDPGKGLGAAVTAVGAAMTFGGGLFAGAAVAGLSAVGGAFTDGAIGGAVGQAASQAIQPITQSVGSLTGASQVYLPLKAKLTLLYYPPIDDPGYQGLYGYPVMRVATPVEGYCKTRDFSCQPEGAKPQEIAHINRCMDAGVFIE